MLNNVIVVGRVIEKEYNEENKELNFKLIVNRNYKNRDGVYESDIIPIKLNDNMKTSIMTYCEIGDAVAVKGRLESNVIIDDGKNYDKNIEPKVLIVAEKVTFLSSKCNSNENGEENE